MITVVMPLLVPDLPAKRMKAAALEPQKILRPVKRMTCSETIVLRRTPRQYIRTMIDWLTPDKRLGLEKTRELLVQAGYRGRAPYVAYLLFRRVAPIAMLAISPFYIFIVFKLDQPPLIKVGICIAAAYFGMRLPELFVKNKIARRQRSIRRAFPDAVDLLLICVESGMSIEAAFKKVSAEVGSRSIPLAEELTLTTAELSYLPDRRRAYENLARRMKLDGVKSACMALQQAERYGTPMAQTLRVIVGNRHTRLAQAEGRLPACRRR